MSNEYEDIFSSNTEVEVLDTNNKPPKKKFSLDLKNDKILLIQILLFSTWAILTILIYFFGYNLFEPFIEV